MMRILGVLSTLLLAASTVAAQPAFTGVGDTIVEGFDTFGGAGYEPGGDPADGVLDSNAWRVLGMSEGDTDFGDTATSGDHARGTSSGDVTTGGVYAFDVEPGTTNYALGVQPAGSDFTPGSHQLRILNDTGGDVRAIQVSYVVYYRNNENRGQSVSFRVIRASDGAEVAVPSFDMTTPHDLETSPLWQPMAFTGVIDIDSIAIGDGDHLILSWDSDDATGSDARDEIAIDDIEVSIPTCGNGVVDGGEACDDGDIVTESECDYGVMSCTLCNATCDGVLTLTGRYCGDTTVDSGDGEVCDDGNMTTETACPYGTMSCMACDDDCDMELSLTGPYCGDGAVESGEEVCDDGNTTTESECTYGTATCTACDEMCDTELSLTGRYCGDGTTDSGDGEECDDGNSTAGDGCSPSCTIEMDAGPPDAGPVVTDAGTDAGPVETDAGTDGGPVEMDAGTDGGAVEVDAGPAEDAGPEDAGEPDGAAADAEVPTDGGTARRDDGGCGCSAPGAAGARPAMALLALLGLVGLLWRRRR